MERLSCMFPNVFSKDIIYIIPLIQQHVYSIIQGITLCMDSTLSRHESFVFFLILFNTIFSNKFRRRKNISYLLIIIY